MQILEAARYLLAEKGHSQFSMRSVARESKINLKTLQYYFPKKHILLNDVLNYTVQLYFSQLNSRYSRASDEISADEILEAFVDYTFEENQNRFVTRFFPELWAMASHDNESAKAMDRVYTTHRRNIEDMVSAVNPKLTTRVVAHRATIIATAIEGMILIIGEGKPKHKELRGLKKELVKQCLLIAKS